MVLVFETLRWTLYLKGPERANHAAVAVGLNVYSFGGSLGLVATYMNRDQIEVHIFNTVSLRWIKLTPMTTGRGEHPQAVPSMRMGHTAVLIADVIYVWGGFKYTRDFCNVLYAFDVNTHRWFKPTISGTLPEKRYNHSSCVLVKAMYIFGGFNLITGCTNDIHKMDTTTMVWSLINTTGTPAPGSLYHTATIIGNKMYIFGGQGDQFNYSNNMYVFDTETDSWMRTPSTQLLPEKRRGHSAFAYNGELYIFGGDNYRLNRTLDDLWKYNPETFSWKQIEPKGKGPCSSSFRMCCCMVGDRIVLFGGYIPDDLYILDLSPGLKTLCKLAVIHYGLEQSGLPHDIRWELAAMTANSNRTLAGTEC